MAHLPPVTRQNVATTNDLGTVETSMCSDPDVFRADVRTEIRTGVAAARTETHGRSWSGPAGSFGSAVLGRLRSSPSPASSSEPFTEEVLRHRG